MSEPSHARGLVEAEKLRRPGAVELATFVSLAVHIESELLRAMRIAVAPRLDAATEADLWFGPLVRLRGPDGITLHPDVAEVLRNRLKKRWQDPDERQLVERAWLVTQRTHQDTSPALVLEERVAWLVLSGDLRSAEAELDRAVKTLATGARPGITGWFSQAWRRMPAEARNTRAGWLLHQASGRPGPVRIQPATIPDDLLSYDLNLALGDVGDVKIGVRRDGGLFELGDIAELGDIGAHPAAAILVPDTDPRIVEIRWPDEPTPRAEVIPVAVGEMVSRVTGAGRLQLRTARGVLYELAPQPVRRYFIAAGTSHYQDLPSLPNVVRDIEKMTELFTRLGYEHVLPELSHEPTTAQFLSHLEQWLNDPSRQANDMVSLFLTGHGGIDREHFYLYTADSSLSSPASTAVAAAQLGRILASGTAGRVLVILDASNAQRGIEELARESGHRELRAISSAGPVEAAIVGAFVDAFLEALDDETFGPGVEYLPSGALVSVINERLAASGHSQHVSSLAFGGAGSGEFLPNPRYSPAWPGDIDRETQARTTTVTPPSGRSTDGKPTGARIVAVHGLGQQLATPSLLHAQWLPALREGLAAAGAEPIAGEDLAVAFYGDIFLEADGSEQAQHSAEDVGEGLEGEMLASLWRAAEPGHGLSEPGEGLPEPETGPGTGRMRVVQRALRALSQSRFFAEITEHALIGDLKQLTRYLQEPAIRKAARARIADTVGPGTHVVLAHSIGSIVAYEALCAHPEWDVRMFVTLGSPLGWRNFVFDQLHPPPQNGIGSWPGSVQRWVNLADEDDIVALEKRLNPMFAGPVEDLLVDNGAQAHDLTRYLTTIEAGRTIADGLADPEPTNGISSGER